jgi:hypothetical protein
MRYCARPPVAIERLEVLPDGRVLYRLKRAWRNGTTHVVFQPHELLEKLSALIPAPRAHVVRYSGVFAPAAAWRPLVVPDAAAASEDEPARGPDEGSSGRADALVMASVAAPPETSATPSERHGRNYTWSELMKRVWELDVLECPRCHGRMRLLAAIHQPDATRGILECLGLPSRAPPIARAASDVAVSGNALLNALGEMRNPQTCA